MFVEHGLKADATNVAEPAEARMKGDPMDGSENGAVQGNGRLEIHRLGDLEVLEHIQREPKQSRINTMVRQGWQAKKQGILLVAEITNGAHKGVLHVYDGGTRWRVAMRTVGPEYEMPCWVETMSEADAAERFDIFNSESKKPSAYDHYKVGIAYGEPHQIAIKKAFDKLGLVGADGVTTYGNGGPGEVSALATCKRIVHGGYMEDKTLPDDERWDAASERLVEVLGILRDAYSDATAHDGDMLIAVNRLRAQNGPFTDEARSHLVATLSSATVGHWRSTANSLKEASGGSESRGNFIAQLVATSHNEHASSEAAKLRTPLSRRPQAASTA
jgi:hypothetical protein